MRNNPMYALVPAGALLLLMLALVLWRPVASYGEDLGSADIIPGYALPWQWSSQQLVYTVGAGGITSGGNIKVQFPKSWHLSGLSTEPPDDYYATATTAAPNSDIDLSVAHTGIDGRTDQRDWTATLTVLGQGLSVGDVITYTFGDQSGGGRGARSGPRATVEQVRIAVDPNGVGEYIELSEPPTITTRAGTATYLTVVAPSVVTQGSAFEVAVIAQRWPFNVADGYTGTVRLTSTDPVAALPAPYSFTSEDESIMTFTVTLNTAGSHWITAADPELSAQPFLGNPIDCREAEPELELYWGDIHSHTDFSYDGFGLPTGGFEYARDVARLDYYATTDHTYDGSLRYTDEEWEFMRQLVAGFNDPGEFTTFLGYEWTVGAPYGHHNVYFRWDDEEILRARDYPTIEELWAALGDKDALTIPHHTGVQWSSDPSSSQAVDWSYVNERLQTSVEIYSLHGQSEFYDPQHPLSYENLTVFGHRSVPGPHYARDAWAAGQKLGVLASSDDHSTRPGQPLNGLTAVYAENNTREAIFNAIAARRTYGTTGQRILLDFWVDAHMMGESFTATLPYTPTIQVHVVGTDLLQFVELVKYDGFTYTVPYSVSQPGTLEAYITYSDPDFRRALYYVRVQQVNDVYGRPVMAWSSPVWVNMDDRDKRVFLPIVMGSTE